MYQNIDPPQNPLKVLRSLRATARQHHWHVCTEAGRTRLGSASVAVVSGTGQEGLAQGRVAAPKAHLSESNVCGCLRRRSTSTPASCRSYRSRGRARKPQLAHLHRDWGSPLPTSAPGLGLHPADHTARGRAHEPAHLIRLRARRTRGRPSAARCRRLMPSEMPSAMPSAMQVCVNVACDGAGDHQRVGRRAVCAQRHAQSRGGPPRVWAVGRLCRRERFRDPSVRLGHRPLAGAVGRLPQLHYDWGSPLPHLHRDWGSPLPHLH